MSSRVEIPFYRVVIKEWPKKTTTSKGISLRVSLSDLEQFVKFADLNDLAIVELERSESWP